MRGLFVCVCLAMLLTGCASEYGVSKEAKAIEAPLFPEAKPNLQALDIEQRLQKQYAEVGVSVIRVGSVVQVRYPSDRLFEVGKAELIPGADNYLLALWNSVKDCPDLRFSIEGLTDNSGNAEKNLMLSLQRADAVAQYFVVLGMAASMITTQGFGGTLPLAYNDTPEHRALNRLVVVTIRVPKAYKKQ